MGPKYCKPVRKPCMELEMLWNMSMAEVRSKYLLLARLFNKKHIYFLTHDELRQVFKMNDKQIFLCEQLYSASKESNRIGSLDFWAGLALAAGGDLHEKLKFCCSLIDANNDERLSYQEVTVLIICATRGVAKLKGLEIVPEETLDKVTIDAFTTCNSFLKENGEIMISTFVDFIAANELCKIYLIALGAKIALLDTAALVMKRSLFLRELAQTRHWIAETMMRMEEEQSQEDAMLERGGDIKYLKFGPDFKPPTAAAGAGAAVSSTADNNDGSALPQQENDRQSAESSKPTTANGASTARSSAPSSSASRTRPTTSTSATPGATTYPADLGPDHPVNSIYKYDESWMAEIYSPGKMMAAENKLHSTASQLERQQQMQQSNTFFFSKIFEDQLLRQWKKLPQDQDQLAKLDPFTLMAMFEQVEIQLPFRLAKQCLEDIPVSQLGRYYFYDVLKWFRYHFNPLRKEKFRNNAEQLFYNWMFRGADWLSAQRRSYNRILKQIYQQTRIMQGINKTGNVNMAKKLADFYEMALKNPSSISSTFLINESKIKLIPKGIEDGMTKEEAQIFTTSINLNIHVDPVSSSAAKAMSFYQDKNKIIRIKDVQENGQSYVVLSDLANLTNVDIMNYYNERQVVIWKELQSNYDPKGPPLPKEPIQYKSIHWMVIALDHPLDMAHAVLCQQAWLLFLRCLSTKLTAILSLPEVPAVEVEICSLLSMDTTSKRRKSSLAFFLNTLNAMKSSAAATATTDSSLASKKKILLISILSSHDYFIALEKEFLQNDIVLSRCLSHFNLNISLSQTPHEIYENSLKFYKFQEKLFGPLEDELGEDGSNPLKYAKTIRSKKKTLKELLQRVPKMNKVELMKICKENGVQVTFETIGELRGRTERLLQDKLEWCGHGELSQFGKENIKRMFEMIKNKRASEFYIVEDDGNREEEGLNLWEVNEFLHNCGLKTFYSKKEYKQFIDDEELLASNEGGLTVEGLQRFYEKSVKDIKKYLIP